MLADIYIPQDLVEELFRINRNSSYFKGTIDGNFHSISMYDTIPEECFHTYNDIMHPYTEVKACRIIGGMQVNRSLIKNLNIIGNYTSPIALSASEKNLENFNNYANFDLKDFGEDYFVKGLCPFGNAHNIKNCKNYGSISSKGQSLITYGSFFCASDSIDSCENYGNFENCMAGV